MSRSGVYHPSTYDTARDRPSRGSFGPGEHWFYNNWDFNALGSIFRQVTGKDIFEEFATKIAEPIAMNDFLPSDCHYLAEEQSVHPVYKMKMSARDLARFGLLYLREGKWNGMQVLSQEWIIESTTPHSEFEDGRGYGYLWWLAEPRSFSPGSILQHPCYFASGFGGQYVIVIPELDLVVVHVVAKVDYGISGEQMGQLLDLVVGSHSG